MDLLNIHLSEVANTDELQVLLGKAEDEEFPKAMPGFQLVYVRLTFCLPQQD
jgi:hypothetical protein